MGVFLTCALMQTGLSFNVSLSFQLERLVAPHEPPTSMAGSKAGFGSKRVDCNGP